MMLRLHPRSTIVTQARQAYVAFMAHLEQQYDLTYDEMFMLHGGRAAALATGLRRDEDVLTAITTAAPNAVPRLTEVLRAYVDALGPIQEKFSLTYGEWLSLLGNAIADLAKYLIRTERHPNDPDKRGDEA